MLRDQSVPLSFACKFEDMITGYSNTGYSNIEDMITGYSNWGADCCCWWSYPTFSWKMRRSKPPRNVTTDCTFLLAIISSSQAPSLLLQLVNTLLLSPIWRKARLDLVRAKGWPPTSWPGSALSPFLKSTLYRDLYKWAWTAPWPLAGHETGRLPSWEKDLWADNEDFSCCDILLCADVLSWVPWVTTRADLWLLNS